MSDPVSYEREGSTVHLLIDAPAVLDASIRESLANGLRLAMADDAVRAVLIASDAPVFPLGEGVDSISSRPGAPSLTELCDLIEGCAKPVLVAMSGSVFGPGLEFAMACHYRIAKPDVSVSMPDINLGLVPSAGGTQRLPRLIGPRHALEMLLVGRQVGAEQASRMGLIDLVDIRAPGDLVSVFLDEGMPARPTREVAIHMHDAQSYLAQIASYREASASHPAGLLIVDCVEAALLLPADAAFSKEQDAAQIAREAPDSIALRYLFSARARASSGPSPKLIRLGLVGGGGLASLIAILSLDAGLPVTVLPEPGKHTDAFFDKVRWHYEAAISRGEIDNSVANRRLAGLTLATGPERLSEFELVIEASADDDLEAKSKALSSLGRVMQPGAVVATTLTQMDLEDLAMQFAQPEILVGMGIGQTTTSNELIEVTSGSQTSPDAIARLSGYARLLGKGSLSSRSNDGGGVVVQLLRAMRLCCDAMLIAGAQPHQIDAALKGYGFALGPYQQLDRDGLDRAVALELNGGAGSQITEEMRRAGFLGRKTRKGFYLYGEAGRPPVPNREVAGIIAKFRKEPLHVFKPPEICERVVLSLINEGARLLRIGAVAHPSDIDLALVFALGFPRLRGGALFQADLMTPAAAAMRIKELGDISSPDALLTQLAAEQSKFSDLSKK